jgi:hypothetical protein
MLEMHYARLPLRLAESSVYRDFTPFAKCPLGLPLPCDTQIPGRKVIATSVEFLLASGNNSRPGPISSLHAISAKTLILSTLITYLRNGMEIALRTAERLVWLQFLAFQNSYIA